MKDLLNLNDAVNDARSLQAIDPVTERSREAIARVMACSHNWREPGYLIGDDEA